MSNKLSKILSDIKKQDLATAAGRNVHTKMQHLVLDKDSKDEMIEKILSNPMLLSMFCKDSKTEIPVAGYINGKFVSRRIDRLYINEKEKCVYVLDYKTDINKSTFFDSYVKQIHEYTQLLNDIYPGYKIRGFLLWLHDFELTEIV